MSLEALGLTAREAAVYRAVAERRSAPAADVPALTGFPPDEVAQAVDALIALGLLDTAPDGVLLASPPELTGQALLLDRTRELHRARQELNELAERYRSVPAGDAELIELLPGPSVGRRLAEVQGQAEREVLIVDAPPYLDVKANPMQLEQMAAGITYRTIYDRRGLEEPGGFERAEGFVDAGEQARILDHTPTKLVIVDRTYALLPQRHGVTPSECGAFLVHRSPLLDTLVSLFDILWLHALPMSAAGTDGLSEEDSQLLVLLLTGFTDDAICRQLGIGRRTVARRVKALMERAGAATRMQLGWQAAQLGWVTAPWRASGLRRVDIPSAASPDT